MAGTATPLTSTTRAAAGARAASRAHHPAGRRLAAVAPETREAVVLPLPPRPGRPVAGGAVVVPLRPEDRPPVPASVRPAPARPAPVRSAPVRLRPEQRPPVPVRLTRRGRVVLGGLGVVTAVAVAALVGPALGGSPAGPELELAGRATVTVHSGDTLWSIARSVAPGTDPREVVDALQDVNGIDGADLVPGQVLLLP
ncbi:LysM peptidoglycan-binding domain-containing protein [Klenkia taihuensis]|uniref:LysM domain-containing protein n=1 Tax=Klenkia taihuensis TaxID=1225127 RepID=A0A1I1V8Q8_9ACTN|nr:LysM peptidoglycan-binding domain-containing protein [Klenkia taihuensis]GHE14514.1 hypothetical protein GCM10011381_41330 [Klenkia taihuensis]SFD78368.1 LysM domain-containing protein [Klenkia taihuensis]